MIENKTSVAWYQSLRHCVIVIFLLLQSQIKPLFLQSDGNYEAGVVNFKLIGELEITGVLAGK